MLAPRDVASMGYEPKAPLGAARGTEQPDPRTSKQVGGMQHAGIYSYKKVGMFHESYADIERKPRKRNYSPSVASSIQPRIGPSNDRRQEVRMLPKERVQETDPADARPTLL